MSEIKETYTVNKTAGTVECVFCAECNRETKHDVKASLDNEGEESDVEMGWGIDWVNNYQVVQCRGCEAVTFREVHWFSEDDPGDAAGRENLYPKRNANTIKSKPFSNLPSHLRRIFREVVDCYNNDSPTLCAAGLRAIVEGVCADKGISDGPVVVSREGKEVVERRSNLEGKISGLHEGKLLTEARAQTLHDHRCLGNEAIHELVRPSAEELAIAIEIIEHTLEDLYEIPQKALDFRRSTKKRKSDV